jgi:hypothetical protein
MLGTLLTTPLCGPASAAVVRSLADAALPASGKVSIAAYAVSAPLAGLSVSYLLTAAAALVAFTAPVGLQAWENRKMQASVSALAVPPKETTGKKEGALPQDPALTAFAASLRALKPSDHEGLLELVLMTSGLPKESLPGAWELLRDAKIDGTVTRALFARWSEVDLPGAIAAVEKAGTDLSRREDAWHGIAAIWAVRDPDAYFAKMAEDPAGNLWPADRNAPRTWQQAAFSAGLSYLALANPEAVLKMVPGIPGETNRFWIRRMALSLWAQRDCDGALNSLQSTFKDEALDSNLYAMAQELMFYRPDLAMKVNRQQQNPHFRESEFGNILNQWVHVAPAEALAALKDLPEEMRTASVAQNAAASLFRNAPSEATAFVASVPAGEFREELLRSGAGYLIDDRENQNFPAAMGLASQMVPGNARQALFEKGMSAWVKADASAARQWADGTEGFPAELKTKLFHP